MAYSGISEAVLDESEISVRNFVAVYMKRYGTTWSLTDGAYREMAEITLGHPGLVGPLLAKLDPEPGQCVTAGYIKKLGIDPYDVGALNDTDIDMNKVLKRIFKR